MEALKILTLIASFFLVQSQGEGSFKLLSIGYQTIDNNTMPTFCFLKASKIESGPNHLVFGSFGYSDGKICGINGTTDYDGGDLCFTRGIDGTVIRNGVPQVVCNYSSTEGYDMKNNYFNGTADDDHRCLLSRTSVYLNGIYAFYGGSSGLVHNDTCWVKGGRLGQNECYRQGTIGTYGTAKKACYLTTEFSYALGTGFVQVNKMSSLKSD